MVVKTKVDDEQAACGGLWHSIDAGTKISKIRYVGEQQPIDLYLTGTWDERVNKLSLWKVYYGKQKVASGEYFQQSSEHVTNSSINDI